MCKRVHIPALHPPLPVRWHSIQTERSMAFSIRTSQFLSPHGPFAVVYRQKEEGTYKTAGRHVSPPAMYRLQSYYSESCSDYCKRLYATSLQFSCRSSHKYLWAGCLCWFRRMFHECYKCSYQLPCRPREPFL